MLRMSTYSCGIYAQDSKDLRSEGPQGQTPNLQTGSWHPKLRHLFVAAVQSPSRVQFFVTPMDPSFPVQTSLSLTISQLFLFSHSEWRSSGSVSSPGDWFLPPHTQAPFVVVVELLSPVWLFVTPWPAAHQASLSFIISQNLLKLMPILSVMPSNHVILCHPLLLLPSIFPSIRVFSNESALGISWLKYWSFNFSISPSNKYSGLIFFRIDWFDLLAVQGILKSLLQHHSWKASNLQYLVFFIVQGSHSYMTTGKTVALTIWIFIGKVMSLLFFFFVGKFFFFFVVNHTL